MIITFSFGVPAARSFRCGRNLVREGDHKYEVLSACGQPTIRETIGIDHKWVGEYRIIEEWFMLVKGEYDV